VLAIASGRSAKIFVIVEAGFKYLSEFLESTRPRCFESNFIVDACQHNQRPRACCGVAWQTPFGCEQRQLQPAGDLYHRVICEPLPRG
jgi:hypothetical protein